MPLRLCSAGRTLSPQSGRRSILRHALAGAHPVAAVALAGSSLVASAGVGSSS